MNKKIILQELKKTGQPSGHIVRMLPPEAANISMDYDIYDSLFGKTLIASTDKGISYIALGPEDTTMKELKQRYPKARLTKHNSDLHSTALSLISHPAAERSLPLHIPGTDFQMKVWVALLCIPPGKMTTYKAVAGYIGHSRATRAVGTAVGQNPVCCLIPCHRVIRSDNTLGGYHWGLDLKRQILDHETID